MVGRAKAKKKLCLLLLKGIIRARNETYVLIDKLLEFGHKVVNRSGGSGRRCFIPFCGICLFLESLIDFYVFNDTKSILHFGCCPKVISQ